MESQRPLKTSTFLKKGNLYNQLLVFILFLHAILVNTRYDLLQSGLEIILIFLISFGINFRKLAKIESILIFSGLISVGLSYIIYNEIAVIITNLRLLILVLLVIIITRQRIFNSFSFLKIIFILNLFIIFSKTFLDIDFLPREGVVKKQFDYFLDGRSFGLFYSFHFSSFIIAVYLLKFSKFKNKILKFSSVLLLFPSKSYFVIVGYIYAIVPKFYKSFLFVVALIFSILWHKFDAYNVLIFIKSRSFGTILYQLFDFDRYKSIAQILPRDYDTINSNLFFEVDSSAYFSRGLLIENEIQYFSLVIQFGLPIAILLLLIIFKRGIKHRSFLFFTMFHYAYILNPMMLFIILMKNEKKS